MTSNSKTAKTRDIVLGKRNRAAAAPKKAREKVARQIVGLRVRATGEVKPIPDGQTTVGWNDDCYEPVYADAGVSACPVCKGEGPLCTACGTAGAREVPHG